MNPPTKECCDKCKENPPRKVYQSPDVVCINSKCECHGDKGEKIRKGAEDFANHFEGVMQELAEEEATPEWEERFDERFEKDNDLNDRVNGWLRRINGDGTVSIALPQDVKNFIRTEIQAAEERGYNKGKENNERYQKQRTYGEDATIASEGYEQGRADVLKELEEKLPPERKEVWGEGQNQAILYACDKGYNQCHTAVLQLIRTMKE